MQGDEADVQQIDRVSGEDQEPTLKQWSLQKGLYKSALTVGEKWTELGINSKDVADHSETKVVGEEWLDTAIGPLKAFKLESDFRLQGTKYHQVFWFSPVVGNVVRLFYLDERGQPTQGTEITCFATQGRAKPRRTELALRLTMAAALMSALGRKQT